MMRDIPAKMLAFVEVVGIVRVVQNLNRENISHVCAIFSYTGNLGGGEYCTQLQFPHKNE